MLQENQWTEQKKVAEAARKKFELDDSYKTFAVP